MGRISAPTQLADQMFLSRAQNSYETTLETTIKMFRPMYPPPIGTVPKLTANQEMKK